jgi:hypothetical protein
MLGLPAQRAEQKPFVEPSIRAVATSNAADRVCSILRNAGSIGNGAGGTNSGCSAASGTNAAINSSRTRRDRVCVVRLTTP